MQQRSVLGNVLKNIFTKYPVTSKKTTHKELSLSAALDGG